MKVVIEQVSNGFKVLISGYSKKNGEYVYRSDEEQRLIAEIGELMTGYKIKVERS